MDATAPIRTTTFSPGQVIRPDPSLMRYYLFIAALTVFGFPFAALAYYFRYITLRYRFDADEDGGVWMAHGILFKKEVNLTYRRIQDIHVTRNILQRWMGLATVSVQTASGSSTPEMTIEGVLDPDALRDYLYQHMRGAKGQAPIDAHAIVGGAASSSTDDEALTLLRDIRDSLADLRDSLARSGGSAR